MKSHNYLFNQHSTFHPGLKYDFSIKCPLSPRQVSGNNPCPSKHLSSFSNFHSLPKGTPRRRVPAWKGQPRSISFPALSFITHFQNLLNASIQFGCPVSADCQFSQREPGNKDLLESWCPVIISRMGKVPIPLPSSTGFIYFKSHLMRLLHQ